MSWCEIKKIQRNRNFLKIFVGIYDGVMKAKLAVKNIQLHLKQRN